MLLPLLLPLRAGAWPRNPLPAGQEVAAEARGLLRPLGTCWSCSWSRSGCWRRCARSGTKGISPSCARSRAPRTRWVCDNVVCGVCLLEHWRQLTGRSMKRRQPLACRKRVCVFCVCDIFLLTLWYSRHQPSTPSLRKQSFSRGLFVFLYVPRYVAGCLVKFPRIIICGQFSNHAFSVVRKRMRR